MKKILFSTVLVLSLLGATALFARSGKPVVVRVTNIPTTEGKILLSTADGSYYGTADATTPAAEIKLKRLPDGKYTLYVFHDANGNYLLDKEGELPAEYCATAEIEVTSECRNFTVALVDIREQVRLKCGEQ